MNHDGDPFCGRLDVGPAAGGAGAWLRFDASGDDGTLYHEEHTLIAPDARGALALWSLNSNTRALTALALRRGELRGGEPWVVFGLGDPANRSELREELSVGLHADGSITYAYAWGMPGGVFADRSGVRMARDRAS